MDGAGGGGGPRTIGDVVGERLLGLFTCSLPTTASIKFLA
jgi:hypothetical protein